MPYQPTSESDIRESVETEITNRAPSITAWFKKTGNSGLSGTLSEGLANREQELLYAWLSCTLRYAGKTITEADCLELSLDPSAVDLPKINALQSDADLDQQALDRGVTRYPGAYARGELTITFAENGQSMGAGIQLSAPTATGDGTLSYVTTEPADAPENSPVATVPFRAAVRGPEYNTGSERVTTVVSTPENSRATIQRVSNAEAVTGGEGPEDNAELRERARGASLEDANLERRLIAALNTPEDGGGVTERDIHLDEHRDGQPVREETQGAAYGIVIIDYNGGTDNLVDTDGNPVGDIQALVDSEKAYGIGVFYEPPDIYELDVEATVAPGEPEQTTATPQDINANQCATAVVQMVSELGLGDDLYSGDVEHVLREADEDVAYAPSVDMTLTAPDGSTEPISRASRRSIAKSEKVAPGEVTVQAVNNDGTPVSDS